MTNDEAIVILIANYPDAFHVQHRIAVDMAIKALKVQNTAEDTISRQAAIDAMATWDWQELYLPIHFKQLLEELPSAQPEQRWIPVSERLPEEETDVIVCNANGDIEISRGSYSTEMKNEFIWYTSGWRFGKVIAWMPLPEPHKEI